MTPRDPNKKTAIANRVAVALSIAAAPTPTARAAAAFIGATMGFGLCALTLILIIGDIKGMWWICAIAAGGAAAYGAATTRWGLAAVYGTLGALWMVVELVIAFFAAVLTSIAG